MRRRTSRVRLPPSSRPGSAKIAGLVFGNGCAGRRRAGIHGRRVVRPCDRRAAGGAFAGLWQPLQVSSSPARTCSQLSVARREPRRRPLASSTLIPKATFAGTFTLHRAVRLDRRVAEDLAHAERAAAPNAESSDVAHVVVRLRNGLLDAQEARGARASAVVRPDSDSEDSRRARRRRRRCRRRCGCSGCRRLRRELGVEVDAGHASRMTGGSGGAASGDDFGVDEAFAGLTGSCVFVARVVDPDAVQRRRGRASRIGEALLGAGHDAAGVVVQAALRPGPSRRPVPSRSGKPSDSGRRARAGIGAHVVRQRADLRRARDAVVPRRLRVLDVGRVSISTRSPPCSVPGTDAPAPACGRPHRARAEELDLGCRWPGARRAGGVAVRAVEQLRSVPSGFTV